MTAAFMRVFSPQGAVDCWAFDATSEPESPKKSRNFHRSRSVRYSVEEILRKAVIPRNGRKRTKNTRCSFHCNCLILGEVARPERFELPAFRFVGRSAKASKCRYSYRLRAKRATYSALKLDGSWTEPKMWCARGKHSRLGPARLLSPVSHQQTKSGVLGELLNWSAGNLEWRFLKLPVASFGYNFRIVDRLEMKPILTQVFAFT